MNGTYSPEVATAIDLIWKSFNKEKMQQGYAMLEKAANTTLSKFEKSGKKSP